MDSTRLHVDRIDVWQNDNEHALSLDAAGIQVMLIRLRYDGWVDEVINGAGTVAAGPGAWTLIGHELTLEFSTQAAATLGFPRDCRLLLDVGVDAIRLVRAALLEILDCACFVVDTAEGRLTMSLLLHS
ncbi:hypothetical protein [Actinoplanes sp. N902-109]|uniref:hypothetical protein n=1 Tax=Actinoplanes sp. (strain N902-109) TaxID=649831 RepID=UPI000329544B|nr:hypothetical protein [Actinoplanes sp. N902-109]AGL19757.1 hypothetical protein L083_6247 [Actinoplanes sp. N902-109]